MDRLLRKQGFRDRGEAEVGVDGSGPTRPGSSLPPTRAARPARSRGVFFEGRLAALVRWVAGGALVAVAAISIAATAPRVLDAPGVFLNTGPALVAATSKLPAIFSPKH